MATVAKHKGELIEFIADDKAIDIVARQDAKMRNTQQPISPGRACRIYAVSKY